MDQLLDLNYWLTTPKYDPRSSLIIGLVLTGFLVIVLITEAWLYFKKIRGPSRQLARKLTWPLWAAIGIGGIFLGSELGELTWFRQRLYFGVLIFGLTLWYIYLSVWVWRVYPKIRFSFEVERTNKKYLNWRKRGIHRKK